MPIEWAEGSAPIRFGEFELDESSRELRRNGARISLQDQPCRLLSALIGRAGQVVTRDQLREELWPGDLYVDFEHGLNTTVRRLREALGDSADTPRFIETLPRRGYRFIGSVERSAPNGARRLPVAVLPFLNLVAESETAYLADGITEDLITELAKVPSLKVVSRTSAMRFRDREQDVREVARALRVDVVIEGSVRTSSDRVRIAVRAVRAASDEQVWAETYDRQLTDIFSIQKDVAVAVVSALTPGLPPAERARLGHPATTDLEAYSLYLRGRHCIFQFTERGIRQGIEYFQRACTRDPSYALPHAGIGFAYMVLGIGHGAGNVPPSDAQRRSRHAVDRALAIDPGLAEAHSVDACLKFMVDFDWVGAEAAFQRAIALGPASSETFDTYGLMLSSLGRYDEALAAQRHAHYLDPLAPFVMSDTASTLLRAERYDEAAAQARDLLRLEPGFPMAHSTLGWAHVKKGAFGEGVRELEQAVALSPGNTLFLAQLGQAYAMTGASDRARDMLAHLRAMARERYVSPYHLAYIYTGLREFDAAIDALESAVDQRAGGVYGIRGSFLFTDLRSHPRFNALLRKMNLA